jgi:hypothetical protein
VQQTCSKHQSGYCQFDIISSVGFKHILSRAVKIELQGGGGKSCYTAQIVYLYLVITEYSSNKTALYTIVMVAVKQDANKHDK